MPDWRRYHAAILAGTLQHEIPAACELAWSCLDLPPEACRDRIAQAVASEEAARWLLQALSLVRLRLLREAGFGPDDSAGLTALDERLRAGLATDEERALARRIGATLLIGQVATEMFPAARLPPPAVDADMQALLASLPPLTDAMHGCEVGLVTAGALAALRAAIDAFAGAGEGWAGAAARDRQWWLGQAWWTLGRGALELGRIEEGRAAFTRAAACYEAAGEAAAAEDCRRRLNDLDLGLRADFDSAAARELQALLARQDPLGRARSLTRLLRITDGAGDLFEAERLAEAAAETLVAAGYPDPEPDLEAATDRWIDTAIAAGRGHAVFARLNEVAEYWAAVLGARANARIRTDAEGAARAEQRLRQLPQFAAQLFEQAGIAEQQAAQRMACWTPQPSGPPYRRHDIGPSMDRSAELAAIDDALFRLRLDCNAAADESHLERARQLQGRAEALGSRVHIARAQLEQAYVLLALGRNDQVQAPAQAALRTLLGGRTARLSAFATGYERELYLNAIVLQARALAPQRAFEPILALCVPVIGDIESERARVNSPYAQSAFLATRAELYEFVAVAACRTGQWDLLLATTELLKARAALRSRLVPAVDAECADGEAEEDVDAQLRQVNDRLAAVGDAGAQRELLERRQWLHGARAIARARGRGDLPELTVASLQRALAADEAAVSWFWVGSEHLIAMAISRDDFGAEVIALDRERQAALAGALDAIGRLAGDEPDYAMLIPQVEAQFEALGQALLPELLRRLIDGRARLLLCPHRSLHLLPLHALPWRRGATTVPLVEQFALLNVPNLSSLLLPWRGNRSGPVLAVGVGRFDAPLGDLPQAEAEAEAVAAAHGANGRRLLGATRADFLAQPLQDFRCLHLATHGASVLAGGAVDDPLEASIHLRDRPLTGSELTALPLRAELVVLAACHSGQRAVGGRGLRELPGDDLFGLQAVLFEAGAGTVLGTLWPVDDETARAILVDFHRAYAGGAAPEVALQAAIRAHRADPRRRRGLFYWAPFFLISLGRTAPVPDAEPVGR